MKIRKMTNESPGFYETLGPYLANREVIRDLGIPPWDDDGKAWFVATKGRRVLGFCAYTRTGAKVHLESAYVVPEARGAGVYDALFRARLEDIEGPATMRSTIRPAALKEFQSHGFRVVRRLKNYVVVEKEL
jgi:ribosomal protein S18 acetylase RimI-like enzyme